MKKILVPCDFSKPAQQALKLAIDIASKTKGEVIVLYVIYVPVVYDYTLMAAVPMRYDETFTARLEVDGRKDFEKIMQALSPKIKVSLSIANGDISNMIKNAVDEKMIDLIVMGTSGATGLEEKFIGSNTEKIVRHSAVPVIAVHSPVDVTSIKRILLPTTLGLNQVEFMIRLKQLLKLFNARLEVLLINTPTNFRTDVEAKESLEEFARHYSLTDYEFHFVNSRNEEEGIMHFVHHNGIDLIAMATHARKGLAHLLNRSITEDIVNHIQCPVWTFCIK